MISVTDYYEILRALYFSIITMTTVGFGDISPITRCTRILVASEALFGIFMLAVLLGVLLGQRRLYVPIPGGGTERRP